MPDAPTDSSAPSARLLGWLLIIIIGLQIGRETTSVAFFEIAAIACLLVLMAVIAATLRGLVGFLFLAASIALTIAEVMVDPDWPTQIWKALGAAAFFVAFFSALTTLRNAAGNSPAMAQAGRYLARQPPGRRYLALSGGAQAFAILLNYGAIQLLGSLAMASAEAEPDERIRKIRTRRMLQAIHRGFVSSLPWSPLSFSIAISVAVIPGTSWAQLAVPGLVTSAIILGTGWTMDTIFKPRAVPGAPPPPSPGETGRWTTLLPLGFLMVLMVSLLVTLETLLPIRVVGLVLMTIPALSLGWVLLQLHGTRGLGDRLSTYLGAELPTYRKEILLIATAGYIGAIGSVLLGPIMRASGIDLTVMPTWALLIALIWIMPALGQIGANPILSMSLIGPLLPPAADLGISPISLAVALICGWTMTGITSPFTATNLLIGRFGHIRPIDVGWRWNRGYFFVTITLLCGWSLALAALSAP